MAASCPPQVQGCYLEIVPNRKLIWTSALGSGYRPHDPLRIADAPSQRGLPGGLL